MNSGAFAPGFALGVRLRGIGGDFATVDSGITLGLALKFSAKFFFGHSLTCQL